MKSYIVTFEYNDKYSVMNRVHQLNLDQKLITAFVAEDFYPEIHVPMLTAWLYECYETLGWSRAVYFFVVYEVEDFNPPTLVGYSTIEAQHVMGDRDWEEHYRAIMEEFPLTGWGRKDSHWMKWASEFILAKGHNE